MSTYGMLFPAPRASLPLPPVRFSGSCDPEAAFVFPLIVDQSQFNLSYKMVKLVSTAPMLNLKKFLNMELIYYILIVAKA